MSLTERIIRIGLSGCLFAAFLHLSAAAPQWLFFTLTMGPGYVAWLWLCFIGGNAIYEKIL
jgi:hypothetical protein